MLRRPIRTYRQRGLACVVQCSTTFQASLRATRRRGMTPRPRVLITNDDGITAPGLIALVAALAQADFCDVSVCAPINERSAQSHAITLTRYLALVPSSVPGAKQAFAVDGTPADCVMLALEGPVFREALEEEEGGEGKPLFDLVLSGINRGDNCGLHVIYSGTVAGAREAACKGLPGLAFSLASGHARKVDDYFVAALLAACLVRAALDVLLPQPEAAAVFRHSLLNVNIPPGSPEDIQGYYQAAQGHMCVQPIFQEVPPEQVAEALAGPAAPLHVAQGEQPPPRLFRNHGGLLLDDQTPGTDKWAVSQGWVAVTPLGLRSDVAPPLAQDVQLHSAGLHNVVAAVLSHAAQLAGVRVGGIRAMSASNPGRYGTIVVPCLDAAAAAAAGAAPKGAAVAAPMDDDTFYVSPPAPTYCSAAAGTDSANE